MASRFEQVIEEIEDYIDECKFVPLSNTKIQVDRERLFDLLGDVRNKTPDEVKIDIFTNGNSGIVKKYNNYVINDIILNYLVTGEMKLIQKLEK